MGKYIVNVYLSTTTIKLKSLSNKVPEEKSETNDETSNTYTKIGQHKNFSEKQPKCRLKFKHDYMKCV